MSSILEASRSMGVKQNITIRVLDSRTHEILQEHTGHNNVTNSLLTGIAHYLTGDGILNQGSYMLSSYVPKYISLGTMGLINQDCDESGLPSGIGEAIPGDEDEEYQRLLQELSDAKDELDAAQAAFEDSKCQPILLLQATHDAMKSFVENYNSNEYPKIVWPAIPSQYGTYLDMYEAVVVNCECCNRCEICSERIRLAKEALEAAQRRYDEAKDAVMSYSEERRFRDYMSHCPGYGADGYDEYLNNGREFFGLGPEFRNRPYTESTVQCELVSDSFPRVDISYRDIVPEIEAEIPKTIDVVYSAMISTGALKQFRESGRSYLFITECGLWSKRAWESEDSNGDNGLLAAYRIACPNEWQREVVANNLTRNAIRQYLISQGVTNPTEEQIDQTDKSAVAKYNRDLLKKQIIRVGINQVVQVIWKIQLGSIDEFASMQDLRKQYYQLYEEEGNASEYTEAVLKLKALRNKYTNVPDLENIFELIDEL